MQEENKTKQIKAMKRNDIKDNKAITLVALVVTIIILIILAAISINLVLGENGIFQRARDGRNNYQVAANEEAVVLGSGESTIDSWINGNGGGSGGGEDTGSIRITEFSIAGTPVTDVPLPSDDFAKVAGTEIGNSYVAKGKTGTAYADDEFVWVPVDKNQQFKVKIEGTGNIASVVLTNPVGDTKTLASNVTAPQNITGISPTVEEKVYNGKYKVIVTTEEGEQIEKILDVYSLYALNVELFFAKAKAQLGDDFEATLASAGGPKTIMSAYSEPNGNFASRVEANGGFWIARYEASYRNGKPASVQSTNIEYSGDTNNLTNGTLWNYISRDDALSVATGYSTTLNSLLPTGAAWDRTLGWLYETRNKDISKLAIDSKDWGNYSDDTFTEGKSLINTGTKNQTIANNIYDLAGNLAEWSTENCAPGGSTSPVRRGGYYICSGSNLPAAARDNSGAVASYDIGFRLVLYK